MKKPTTQPLTATVRILTKDLDQVDKTIEVTYEDFRLSMLDKNRLEARLSVMKHIEYDVDAISSIPKGAKAEDVLDGARKENKNIIKKMDLSGLEEEERDAFFELAIIMYGLTQYNKNRLVAKDMEPLIAFVKTQKLLNVSSDDAQGEKKGV